MSIFPEVYGGEKPDVKQNLIKDAFHQIEVLAQRKRENKSSVSTAEASVDFVTKLQELMDKGGLSDREKDEVGTVIKNLSKAIKAETGKTVQEIIAANVQNQELQKFRHALRRRT